MERRKYKVRDDFFLRCFFFMWFHHWSDGPAVSSIPQVITLLIHLLFAVFLFFFQSFFSLYFSFFFNGYFFLFVRCMITVKPSRTPKFVCYVFELKRLCFNLKKVRGQPLKAISSCYFDLNCKEFISCTEMENFSNVVIFQIKLNIRIPAANINMCCIASYSPRIGSWVFDFVAGLIFLL